MDLSFKRVVSASISIALVAGTTLIAEAAPGPVVLGGGATLPVPAYLGKSVNGGFEKSGTASFGASGSLFGEFGAVTGGLRVDYCATGSGKGKGIFAGVANTVDIPCADAANAAATTYGFLPPSGSPRQSFPTIAGTDAPLTQADYTKYTTGHAAPMEPVELPSIFGAIAIAYHDSALPANTARITLTDAQICGVYGGTIRTFGQLLGTSDATLIRPIYRSDGSGTSFNFSNHLATVCPAFNGKPFNGNQVFTTADPNLPASAIGANGNGGVLSTIESQNGTIAYLEAGYLPNVPNYTGALNYANVLNATDGIAYDPFAALPKAAASIAAPLLPNVQVVQGAGPATTAPLTGVLSGSCVQIVPPAAYANPRTGYPLVAVTYLLTNSAGNGSTAAGALRLLEQALATPKYFKGGSVGLVTTIDAAGVATGSTGYSTLGPAYARTLVNAANACIGG